MGLIAPLSLLAVILCWPSLRPTPFTAQLENVYGFVGIVGVVIFAILGMLCKILPFLVWTARYSEDIGRRPVPALADLRWAPLEPLAYGLYLAGIVITSIAVAVASETGARCGMVFIAAALLAFVVNAGVALSHLLRPHLEEWPRGATPGNLS